MERQHKREAVDRVRTRDYHLRLRGEVLRVSVKAGESAALRGIEDAMVRRSSLFGPKDESRMSGRS